MDRCFAIRSSKVLKEAVRAPPLDERGCVAVAVGEDPACPPASGSGSSCSSGGSGGSGGGSGSGGVVVDAASALARAAPPPAEIYFNSKSSSFSELSNFVGGVEEEYVKLKFPTLAPLLNQIKACDGDTFVKLLKQLQPGKCWTGAKERYWFNKQGEPIRGVLAKLVANAFQGAPSAAKRRRITAVMDALSEASEATPPRQTLPPSSQTADESGENPAKRRRCLGAGAGAGAWAGAGASASAGARARSGVPLASRVAPGDESIKALYRCLVEKYRQPRFRKLLLSTGDVVLHERPMRGKGNAWTFPGGDQLGRMLCKLRRELREEIR